MQQRKKLYLAFPQTIAPFELKLTTYSFFGDNPQVSFKKQKIQSQTFPSSNGCHLKMPQYGYIILTSAPHLCDSVKMRAPRNFRKLRFINFASVKTVLWHLPWSCRMRSFPLVGTVSSSCLLRYSLLPETKAFSQRRQGKTRCSNILISGQREKFRPSPMLP